MRSAARIDQSVALRPRDVLRHPQAMTEPADAAHADAGGRVGHQAEVDLRALDGPQQQPHPRPVRGHPQPQHLPGPQALHGHRRPPARSAAPAARRPPVPVPSTIQRLPS